MTLEVSDGGFQSVREGDRWFPCQFPLCDGDIGSPLAGIVDRQWPMDDLRSGAGDRDDLFGQIAHGKFSRIAEIDGRPYGRLISHKAKEAVDQIGDIAERARLGPITIDCDVLAFERLYDEIGNDTAVIRAHARSIGIEDTRNPDVDAMLGVKVTEERFGRTLAFIVT